MFQQIQTIFAAVFITFDGVGSKMVSPAVSLTTGTFESTNTTAISKMRIVDPPSSD